VILFMANFKNLTNKEASFTQAHNKAASFDVVQGKAKVDEKTIAKAVKSDATAKTNGGAFGSFIKQ